MLWARSRAWEKVPSTSVAAANKGALCELGVGTRGLATGVKSVAAAGEGRAAQGQCGWCGGPARQEPGQAEVVRSATAVCLWPKVGAQAHLWGSEASHTTLPTGSSLSGPGSCFSTVTPSSPGHTHGPEAAPFEDGKGGGAGGQQLRVSTSRMFAEGHPKGGHLFQMLGHGGPPPATQCLCSRGPLVFAGVAWSLLLSGRPCPGTQRQGSAPTVQLGPVLPPLPVLRILARGCPACNPPAPRRQQWGPFSLQAPPSFPSLEAQSSGQHGEGGPCGAASPPGRA